MRGRRAQGVINDNDYERQVGQQGEGKGTPAARNKAATHPGRDGGLALLSTTLQQ
jgi:hypothetical protein